VKICVRSASASATRPAGRAAARRRPQHVFDGPDGGNRILGERKSHGHRASQFAVEVNRAAAHAFHHPGMVQGTARKPSQNQRLLGPGAIEDTQNLNLKLLDFVPREHRAPSAVHTARTSFRGKNELCAARPAANASIAGTAQRSTSHCSRGRTLAWRERRPKGTDRRVVASPVRQGSLWRTLREHVRPRDGRYSAKCWCGKLVGQVPLTPLFVRDATQCRNSVEDYLLAH